MTLTALVLVSSATFACPPRNRASTLGEDKLIISSVPQFDIEMKYGGSIVGPRGQLTDGSKITPVLRLRHGDRVIVIRKPEFHPTPDAKPKPKKKFRFVVIYDRKSETYRLNEVWDGKRRVYPVDLKQNPAP